MNDSAVSIEMLKDILVDPDFESVCPPLTEDEFSLLEQNILNLMMSHINSYTRKKLGNQSAYRLFSFFYGESVLPSLGIREIPANDINLTPRLLTK